MIYRVHVEISYLEAMYDFAKADDAVGFMKNLTERVVMTKEMEERGHKVWMEVVPEEDF